MSEIVGKKIKALPEATTAEDTDVMVIEDGTKTRKIGFGVLRRLLGIDTINNNLQTKMPKTGGAFTGPITVRGNVTALEGRFIDKNGYVVSSGGGSNTVALIWSSAMRFDVYVDGTFVGTLTPIK